MASPRRRSRSGQQPVRARVRSRSPVAYKAVVLEKTRRKPKPKRQGRDPLLNLNRQECSAAYPPRIYVPSYRVPSTCKRGGPNRENIVRNKFYYLWDLEKRAALTKEECIEQGHSWVEIKKGKLAGKTQCRRKPQRPRNRPGASRRARRQQQA